MNIKINKPVPVEGTVTVTMTESEWAALGVFARCYADSRIGEYQAASRFGNISTGKINSWVEVFK